MPDEVRVELLSGERVELMEPRLEADTLVGLLRSSREEVRVPLGEVESIESKETHGLALVVIAVPLALAAIIIIIACSSDCGLGS